MEEEIWKDIPRYIGYYQVSNLGRVRRVLHDSTKFTYMKPTLTIRGFLNVYLCINSKQTTEQIHYLVLEAFTNPHDYKNYIKHLDGIKTNNKLDNLKWINHKCSIQLYQYDLKGNFIKKHETVNDAIIDINVSIKTIYKHLNGQNKTCKGFIFKREKIC